MNAKHRIESMRALAKNLRSSARHAQTLNRHMLAGALRREATRLSNDAKALEEEREQRYINGRLDG